MLFNVSLSYLNFKHIKLQFLWCVVNFCRALYIYTWEKIEQNLYLLDSPTGEWNFFTAAHSNIIIFHQRSHFQMIGYGTHQNWVYKTYFIFWLGRLIIALKIWKHECHLIVFKNWSCIRTRCHHGIKSNWRILLTGTRNMFCQVISIVVKINIHCTITFFYCIRISYNMKANIIEIYSMY